MNTPEIRGALFVVAIVLFATPANAVTYTATLLHPSDYDYSVGRGISGTNQVGYGQKSSEGVDHALLWSGTASSAVDLNPAGFLYARAESASHGSQAGWGVLPGFLDNPHALLWHDTAAGAVDLNPSGFDYSQAFGVSGGNQVGVGGGPATGGSTIGHALLWSGTAASAVDLNPSGFSHSVSHGISGSTQVGWGDGSVTGGNNHALLWSGTAASAVDLHPASFSDSYANSASERTKLVEHPVLAPWDRIMPYSGPVRQAARST